MDAEEGRDANEVGGKVVGCGDQGLGTAYRWLDGSAIVVIGDYVVNEVDVHEEDGWRAHWTFILRGPNEINGSSYFFILFKVEDSLARYRRGLLDDKVDPIIEQPSATRGTGGQGTRTRGRHRRASRQQSTDSREPWATM